jgi:hypothetical protein
VRGGFKFGNFRLWPDRQSMNAAESFFAQNLRSSSSERNLEICFFVLGVNFICSHYGL